MKALHQEKLKLVDHLSQLVRFDLDGNLLDSTDEIVVMKVKTNLFEEIPLLSSLKDTLKGLKSRENITFKCIQDDYFGVSQFFDFTFFHENTDDGPCILLLIQDFTTQYQKVLELQQDRNVESIAKQNAEIEALKALPEAENIFIKVDSLLLNFDPKNILYVEAYGDYIKVHTPDKMYITYTKLKSIEDILPKKDFIRIHRSYIVRIDQIISLNQQRLQIKDTILPISLTHKEELLSRIKKLN